MPGDLQSCNDSRFMLSFRDLPEQDGKSVAFGEIANDAESQAVLDAIEAAGTELGQPQCEVMITDCGQL